MALPPSDMPRQPSPLRCTVQIFWAWMTSLTPSFFALARTQRATSQPPLEIIASTARPDGWKPPLAFRRPPNEEMFEKRAHRAR